jgi:hypothetical protein
VYDSSYRLSKGHLVNIPELGCGFLYGNVSKLGDVSRDPGKSSLFFLTDSRHPEISLAGDRVLCQAEHRNLWCPVRS